VETANRFKRRRIIAKEARVPRVISFIVLLAIILLVGVIFFQVMAQFIVPLFLACVLLVASHPLHGRVLNLMPNHPRIAALVTTVLILLFILLPLVSLGWRAYGELRRFVPHDDPIVKATAADASNTAVTVKTGGESTELTVTENPSPAVNPTTPPDPVATQDATSADPNAKSEAAKKRPSFMDRLNDHAIDLRNKFQEVTGIEIGDGTVRELVKNAGSMVATKALGGVQFALGTLIGLAIMVIALYYFLADGPAMIATVLELSPLDARYEQELLERFGDVSRAVVVATLLSALVQGALAGIGYYFALPATAPIFLLTAVTMVTALVPFVGAAATWICVCGYIYFYGERLVNGATVQGDPKTAIILAIYCTIVVSGIDNIIKPFILHGQSKLHPLLALLSILGGIQVLGPVGILVGPMLVSFLQALLNMLRKELDSFGGPVVEGATPLADAGGEAIPPAAGENGEKSGTPAGELAGSKAAQVAKLAPGRHRKRKR
jgi:predicted PurR-regulated permease PerM